jgi:hypothetical protein
MRRILLIAGVLIFSLLMCGCTYINSNSSQNTIPSDKYVGIFEYYYNSSTLIGTPPYPTVVPAASTLAPPGFNFSTMGLPPGEMNDSLKILLFKQIYQETPTEIACTGEDLYGIYSLPYTVEDGYTITNITSNGTVLATYKNQSIILKPGVWPLPTQTINTSGVNTTGAYIANINNINITAYLRSGHNTLPANDFPIMPWPVHNEQNFQFINEGIFNKSILSNSYP